VNEMRDIENFAGFSGVYKKPCGSWYNGFIQKFYETESGVVRPLLDIDNFVSFGFDTTFGNNFVAGFGRDYSEVTTTSKFTNGNNNVSGLKHFAYGSYSFGDFYVDTAFFYGNEDHTNQREIKVGTSSGTTVSAHDSESYSSYIETGKLLMFGSTSFQPFGGLEYMYLKEDGFTESDNGPLTLKIQGVKRDLLISNLGVRATKIWVVDNWMIMPKLSIAWRYDITPEDYNTTASFISAPGEYFAIEGKRNSINALDVGVSLDIINFGKFGASVDFSSELFNNENNYDMGWKLKYDF